MNKKKNQERAKIAADLAAYLENGGEIEEVPFGVLNQKPRTGAHHAMRIKQPDHTWR